MAVPCGHADRRYRTGNCLRHVWLRIDWYVGRVRRLQPLPPELQKGTAAPGRPRHDLRDHSGHYIYGKDDFAAYYGGGEQTIYDFGTGAHLQFSEITAPIKVFGLENDPNAIIDLFNAAPGRTLQADGHGGTMLANIDFTGATVKASQVNFLTTDHPLSTGGFV